MAAPTRGTDPSASLRMTNFREGQDPPLRICVFRMTWFSVAFRNNRPGGHRRRIVKAIALPYRKRLKILGRVKTLPYGYTCSG